MLSTSEPKKQKQKLRKQLEQEQNHRNGDHMEVCQYGGGGEKGGEGTGNKKHKCQAQNRQGEVKNSIGNGEARGLRYTTRGRELRGRGNAGAGDNEGRRSIKRRQRLGKLQYHNQ